MCASNSWAATVAEEQPSIKLIRNANKAYKLGKQLFAKWPEAFIRRLGHEPPPQFLASPGRSSPFSCAHWIADS